MHLFSKLAGREGSSSLENSADRRSAPCAAHWGRVLVRASSLLEQEARPEIL